MTRINLVPVEELCDKHLIAEYHELPRIFGLAKFLPKTMYSPTYILGKGHMKFFYGKLSFLCKRQKMLADEMKRRRFRVNFDPETLWFACDDKALYNDWTPTDKEIKISRDHLNKRKIEMGIYD